MVNDPTRAADVPTDVPTDDPAAKPTDDPAHDAPVVAVAGFDGFYLARHANMVRALSLALGDNTLGREAADEGFTRALQRWSKVGRYENPSGWVYRAGLNWARSRRRKLRREVRRHEPDAATAESLAAPAEVDHRTDPSIVAALAELPLEQRSVVIARYYLDWSEADIADALDIAPGTVKSRASRALSQLAQTLEDPR